MRAKGDMVISAEVLLKSASGKKIGPDTLITSTNIGEYAPAAKTVAEASGVLAKLGFAVGEAVGISMSITASANTFERVFGVPLSQTPKSGIQVIDRDGSLSREIPTHAWPASLWDLAVAITFVPPPDFGPTGYFEL